MSTLHSSLYAIALMGCVICSFVTRTTPQRGSHYLIIYLALESLGFAFEWLMLHPASPGKSLWLGLLMCVSFLLSPCVWLYAREITERSRPPVRSLATVEVCVIAGGILLTLPLIQSSHLGPDYGPGNQLSWPTIHVAMFLSAALFLLQAPFYLRRCLRRMRLRPDEAPPAQLGVLRILLLAVGLNWFVSLLRVLHCVLLGKDTGLGLVFAFMEVGVTLWAIFSLLRPTVDSTPLPAIAGTIAAPAVAKYGRSALDAPTRARIQRKLLSAMTELRLHRDSELSLRALCDRIRENPHYVSQVLNQDLATNFHDFVNRQRIEDAKVALRSSPARSILEIALDVGFNSKSTFNAAFRTHAGTTPSEYRRPQQTQQAQ